MPGKLSDAAIAQARTKKGEKKAAAKRKPKKQGDAPPPKKARQPKSGGAKGKKPDQPTSGSGEPRVAQSPAGETKEEKRKRKQEERWRKAELKANGPPLDWWERPTRGELERLGVDPDDEEFFEVTKGEYDYQDTSDDSKNLRKRVPPPNMGYEPMELEEPSKLIRSTHPNLEKRMKKNNEEGEDKSADEANLDVEFNPQEETLQGIHVGENPSQDITGSERFSSLATTVLGPTPSHIMLLPMEVRFHIFKHHLISDKPIMVQDQWKRPRRCFRSERSTEVLHPKLLMVCWVFYQEGVQILYKENTFHYRIRDAAPLRPLLWPLLDGGSRDSDDDEYDETPKGKRDRKNKGKAKETHEASEAGLINVRKFRHLFRRLILEAEHNRVDDHMAEIIVKAISVFEGQAKSVTDTAPQGPEELNQQGNGKQVYPGKLDVGQGLPPNLHTFVLRVAPVWTGWVESFNILPWFAIESPILQALSKIDSQYINIDLIMRYVYGDVNSRLPIGRRGKRPPERDARLKLDMRHKRVVKHKKGAEKEPRKDVMMRYIQGRANHADAQVLDLKRHVLVKCVANVPEAKDEQSRLEMEQNEDWDDIEALPWDDAVNAEDFLEDDPDEDSHSLFAENHEDDEWVAMEQDD